MEENSLFYSQVYLNLEYAIKKSGKTKTYKGTKRVCTAYSDSYGGVRQCLNWTNEPVYE